MSTDTTFVWTVREGDDGKLYVLEHPKDAIDGIVFGPLPGHAVESFIRARREIVSRNARNRGGIRIITPN